MKKKTKYYYELAAKMGDPRARCQLGSLEGMAGNHERAIKHYAIAAKSGYEMSLICIKEGLKIGLVTKDQYAEALRNYQKSHDEMSSDNQKWYRDRYLGN